EPREIRHLRFYSNYLAPRPGIFSLDGWVLIAVFLRNMLLNQLVLLLALLGLFVFIRAIVEVYAISHTFPVWGYAPHVLGTLAGVLLLWAGWGTSQLLPAQRPTQSPRVVLARFTYRAVVRWLWAALAASLFFSTEHGRGWVVCAGW